VRKLVLSLAVATTIVPGSGHAQVTIDMTRVTCADYLAMPPDQTSIFSAWMSGWFNQKLGYISVGLGDFARNVASVKQWCTTSPRETIMSALERSKAQPGPPGGQVQIDMSLITCKQYLSSDPERQEMIASWMSGYFRAARNQPVVDFQRFSNNKKIVVNYCKKSGGETLMSAIQKNAR
jgi:hypothetical protein